jgi:MFS family permease
LVFVYVALCLGNFVSGPVVMRCASIPLILISSVLLGLGAALLWTAQSTHFTRSTPARSRGESAGFFTTLFAIGSGMGTLLLGLLIPILSYRQSFLIASAVDGTLGRNRALRSGKRREECGTPFHIR